jgi:hypothetical protein
MRRIADHLAQLRRHRRRQRPGGNTAAVNCLRVHAIACEMMVAGSNAFDFRRYSAFELTTVRSQAP